MMKEEERMRLNALFERAWIQDPTNSFPAVQIRWETERGGFRLGNIEFPGWSDAITAEELQALISRAEKIISAPAPEPEPEPTPLRVIDAHGNLEGSDE